MKFDIKTFEAVLRDGVYYAGKAVNYHYHYGLSFSRALEIVDRLNRQVRFTRDGQARRAFVSCCIQEAA